jgi:hypothetical protein
MQDITELERRIAAAFDRIDRGLEQADRARASVAPPSVDTADTAHAALLVRSLESATASNADWAKRYAAVEAQLADVTLSMAGEIAKLTEALATAKSAALAASVSPDQPQQSAQDLQALDVQLAELRRQLAAQETELTQMRAQRLIEIEELKSIVAALTPLIEEAKPHA